MKIISELRFYNISIKEKVTIFATLLVFVGISFLSIFSVKKYLELKDAAELSRQELNQLKNRVDIIKINKSLTQSQLDEYIRILSILIPETEDFFSMINSLEKISQDSGFIINNYNIDLSSTTKEKLSITIGGQGDSNSFINFLSNYKFFSGRLITIEKIQFSTSSLSENKISLNFYNKKLVLNDQIIPQFTKKDIKLLQEIKNKTTFTFKPEEHLDLSYPTKSDPF